MRYLNSSAECWKSGCNASHCPWSKAVGCQHSKEEILQNSVFLEKNLSESLDQARSYTVCKTEVRLKALTSEKKEGQFSGSYVLSTHTLQLLAAILSAQTRNDLFSLPYRRKEQNLLSMQKTSCPADSYQQLCSTHSEHVI